MANARERSVGLTVRVAVREAISKALTQCSQLSVIGSAGGLLLGSVAANAQNVQAPIGSEAQVSALGEIIVTAQRRNQSVQDIPYNITVVDAGQIAASGATGLNDLTRVVPGLTTVDAGDAARGRNNNFTLRGLRTGDPGGGNTPAESPGQTVSPVSTYFGETPVFFAMPLYDLERVEVLRGPQGTLYGSGAQAGTIRFVPRRPEFGAFSGNIEVTGSSTDHSGDLNRDINAVVNLPLAEHLAARVVAGWKHDGGFIDAADLWARDAKGVPIPSVPGDLTSGPILQPVQRDTNSNNKWYARGALRWQATDHVDLQLDYLHQQINSANNQFSNPGFAGGPFDITTPIPGPVSSDNPGHYPHSTVNLRPGGAYTSTAFSKSPYQDKIDLVSAVATVDFGFATVTSASSYYEDRSVAVADYTATFYNPTAAFNYNTYFPYLFYPRLNSVAPTTANDHSYIQELRLVSSGDNRIDYVLGAYYQDQKTSTAYPERLPGIQDYLAFTDMPNPTTYRDTVAIQERENRFKDLAAFSEVTAHITHQWQVTAGLRIFKQKFETDATSRLPLCGAVCSVDLVDPSGFSRTAAQSDVSRIIKKLNMSYDVTPSAKIYATYSEGFRRGGANALSETGPFASLPVYQTYAPDIAKNYELGVKGTLLEHRVRYSADVYRINLNNFQFDTSTPAGFNLTLNGQTARSQGAELEVQTTLGHRTSATFGYTYTDAKVTESFDRMDYAAYALVPGGTGQLQSLLGGGLKAGSNLPGVPRHTVTASIDRVVPVNLGNRGGATLIPHIDGSYRSSAAGDINPISPYNWAIPSSFLGNARVTLDLANKIGFDLFVNNITNNPGYSGGQNVQAFPNSYRFRNITRPRTIGLSARYKFE